MTDDGIENAPGKTAGGESNGGAYPNPQTGKTPHNGFMGHGGQTDNAYRGGADDVAKGDDDNSVTEDD